MKKIVVFASGSGTNFQALIDAAESGELPAEICGLLASRAGIKAIERAHLHNIPVTILNEKDFDHKNEFIDEMSDILSKWSPDLIVLAGYLSKIPDAIIERFENRIINIHPSLLPKYGGRGYYGLNVHKAVLANKETESGCSVHIVTTEYDKGPILDQIKVPVLPDDTPEILQKRILKQEHKLLSRVIKKIITSKH